jgi:hypothetical protein
VRIDLDEHRDRPGFMALVHSLWTNYSEVSQKSLDFILRTLRARTGLESYGSMLGLGLKGSCARCILMKDDLVIHGIHELELTKWLRNIRNFRNRVQLDRATEVSLVDKFKRKYLKYILWIILLLSGPCTQSSIAI